MLFTAAALSLYVPIDSLMLFDSTGALSAPWSILYTVAQYGVVVVLRAHFAHCSMQKNETPTQLSC